MQTQTEVETKNETESLEATDIPECIEARWHQALRVDRADDWREAAVYCSDLAITLYRANGYNPEDPVFKALCRLGRVAFRRAGSRLQQLHTRMAAQSPHHQSERI